MSRRALRRLHEAIEHLGRRYHARQTRARVGARADEVRPSTLRRDCGSVKKADWVKKGTRESGARDGGGIASEILRLIANSAVMVSEGRAASSFRAPRYPSRRASSTDQPGRRRGWDGTARRSCPSRRCERRFRRPSGCGRTTRIPRQLLLRSFLQQLLVALPEPRRCDVERRATLARKPKYSTYSPSTGRVFSRHLRHGRDGGLTAASP